MDSRITGKNDKKNDEKVKIILYIGGIDYGRKNYRTHRIDWIDCYTNSSFKITYDA